MGHQRAVWSSKVRVFLLSLVDYIFTEWVLRLAVCIAIMLNALRSIPRMGTRLLPEKWDFRRFQADEM